MFFLTYQQLESVMVVANIIRDSSQTAVKLSLYCMKVSDHNSDDNNYDYYYCFQAPYTPSSIIDVTALHCLR